MTRIHLSLAPKVFDMQVAVRYNLQFFNHCLNEPISLRYNVRIKVYIHKDVCSYIHLETQLTKLVIPVIFLKSII